MKQQISRRFASRGITLVETTAAITIAAIVIGVAAPSFGEM